MGRRHSSRENLRDHGPVLFFEADGHQLGETVEVPSGKRITLKARVHSRLSVEKVGILHNGKIVALGENPDRNQRLELQTEVIISGSSWVAARAYSSHRLLYRNEHGTPVIAHTSPVYFQVGSKTRKSAEDATFFIQWVDEALEWLDERANLPRPEQRQEMLDLFHKARRVFAEQVD